MCHPRGLPFSTEGVVSVGDARVTAAGPRGDAPGPGRWNLAGVGCTREAGKG